MTAPPGTEPLHFAVLGPLRVMRGDHVLDLGSPQVGVLAALLALRTGQVCSNDLISDVLWGDHPPDAAAKLVQGLVSRLRRVLEPERGASAEAAVLRTRTGGYMLDVETRSVDANVFTDGVLAAQEDLRRADDDAARRRLTEVLALWRGPAAPELSHRPAVVADVARLEDLRLVALESLFESRLALGEDAELVPELEALVALHPLRERLWGSLVLALARSGRQADALRAYQRLRRQLVEELGVEPGADLRRLERAVLEQDAAVLATSHRAAPAGVDATLAIDEGGRREELRFTGDHLTIGSAAGNGLVLTERSVSRVHAVIERVGPGWCVRDLGSTNGTWVNGRAVRGAHVLRPGDDIRVGGVTLRLLVDDYPAEATYSMPPKPALDDEEQSVLDELCRPIVEGSMLSAPASVASIAAATSADEEHVAEVLDRLYERFELSAAERRPGRLALEAIGRGAVSHE